MCDRDGRQSLIERRIVQLPLRFIRGQDAKCIRPVRLLRLISRRPVHRARRGGQSLFRGRRCSILFCALSSNEVVDRAAIQSGCLGGNARASVGPHVSSSQEIYGDAASSMLACGHRAGRRRDPATGIACAALVGAMASEPDFGGWPIAFRSSKASRWGAKRKSKRRRVRAEASVTSGQRWRRKQAHSNARSMCRRPLLCLDRRCAPMCVNRRYW